MNTLEGNRRNSPEIEQKVAVGAALVIVHARTGELWIIEELKNKERTERQVGMLSIPMETRKIGETQYENLLGAMAEVFDDSKESTRNIHDSFFTFDESFIYNTRPLVLSENGKTLVCDVGIVMFDGEKADDMNPYDVEEVRAHGWMSIADFLNSDARFVAKKVVEEACLGGAITSRMQYYKENNDRGKSFFPSGFSVSSNFINRENVPDMIFDRAK